MSKNVHRRIFAALILILFVAIIMPVGAFAADPTEPTEAQPVVSSEAKMDSMGKTAFVWYRYMLICCIPVLIVRYASHGFMILGNTFMTRGEMALDRIKKDILYSSVAVAVLALLPRVLDWSMDLFSGSQWTPPPPVYKTAQFLGEVIGL